MRPLKLGSLGAYQLKDALKISNILQRGTSRDQCHVIVETQVKSISSLGVGVSLKCISNVARKS
jgi:hypothetical protein